jgi:hypothetical protein
MRPFFFPPKSGHDLPTGLFKVVHNGISAFEVIFIPALLVVSWTILRRLPPDPAADESDETEPAEQARVGWKSLRDVWRG